MPRLTLVAVCLFAALAPTAAAAPIEGTNGAAVPALEWGLCPAATPEEEEALAGYECTVAEVPLSYRRPQGPTIELALGRLPATDQSNKLGSLFWNPGGPGASGRIPPVFTEALHERFDLVGFDPRGIAASTPLRCFSSNEQAIRLFGQDFPITPAQLRRFIRLNRRGTELCARNGGPVIEHMSTANVARDLDLLRQAVGDPQLSYLGFSYGTAIGEYYANLFPDRVRALTLDAVIDPSEWSSSSRVAPIEWRLGSFRGTDDAFGSFLAACAADARCAFREPAVELRSKYERMLARLRREPVVLVLEEESVEVTYQLAVYVTLGGLYNASDSAFLAEFLQQVWTATEQADGRTRLRGAELRAGYRPVRQAPVPEEPYFGLEWFPAVECTDSVNPANPLAWPRFARLADLQAYPFGSPWVFFAMPCATWPAVDPDRYAGPWDRETANPILLIGNSLGDPATPYEDAQQTEALLSDARLLTLESFGHTALGKSLCIDDAVSRYFIELQLPPAGQVCQPDLAPFDPPPEPAEPPPAPVVPAD